MVQFLWMQILLLFPIHIITQSRGNTLPMILLLVRLISKQTAVHFRRVIANIISAKIAFDFRDVVCTDLHPTVFRSCSSQKSCAARTIKHVVKGQLRSHHVSAVGSNCDGEHQFDGFGKLGDVESFIVVSRSPSSQRLIV